MFNGNGKRKSKNHLIEVSDKYNTLGAFTPPVDEQPDDCFKWQTNEHQIWIIHLSSGVNVQYIPFKLFAENLQKSCFSREFVINVFVNSMRGMDSIECEFNPHPNINFDEFNANNK